MAINKLASHPHKERTGAGHSFLKNERILYIWICIIQFPLEPPQYNGMGIYTQLKLTFLWYINEQLIRGGEQIWSTLKFFYKRYNLRFLPWTTTDAEISKDHRVDYVQHWSMYNSAGALSMWCLVPRNHTLDQHSWGAGTSLQAMWGTKTSVYLHQMHKLITDELVSHNSGTT
jgi:hypothetical protein